MPLTQRKNLTQRLLQATEPILLLFCSPVAGVPGVPDHREGHPDSTGSCQNMA